MSVSISISDDVIKKVHESHLLFLLEDAIDHATRAEASTYYPKGSLLGMLPSDADLEKARTAVIEQARTSHYENLAPKDSGLRPLFEQKDTLHRSFLKEAIANIDKHALEIGETLLGGTKPNRILAFSADGADSHNGARHTMVVETDAGIFLYKPRSLKPDIVVKSLCDELSPTCSTCRGLSTAVPSVLASSSKTSTPQVPTN